MSVLTTYEDAFNKKKIISIAGFILVYTLDLYLVSSMVVAQGTFYRRMYPSGADDQECFYPAWVTTQSTHPCSLTLGCFLIFVVGVGF
jgi:hypothetical protein